MTANQSTPTTRPNHDVAPGPGVVLVYSSDGQPISRFAGAPGTRNVLDVVVDDDLQMLILIGWKQATDWLVSGAVGGPVQIGLIRGVTFQGNLLWLGYDWHTDPAALDGRYLNEMSIESRTVDEFGNVTFVFKSTAVNGNNMADTRLYRGSRGEDGELYVTGHSAGGNHMYRYSPMNTLDNVEDQLATYDFFTSYAGAKDQHLGFVGRYHYNRSAIEFQGGQGVVARLSAILPNTLHAEGGAIAADVNSRLYLGGISACCLPLPPNDIWRPSPGEISLNPFAPTDYLGGAFMLAFNFNDTTSKITGRAFAGRVARGKTKAIAARTIDGVTKVVWGGYVDLASGPMWTADAIQSAPGYGARDGWLMINWRGREAPTAAAAKPLSSYITGFPARVNSTTSVTAQLRNVRPTRINATSLDSDTSTLDARFIYPWSETVPLTPRTGFAPTGNVSYSYSGIPMYGGMVFDIANVNDSTRLRNPPGASWSKGASAFPDTPWIQFGTGLLGGEKAFMRLALFAYTKDMFNASDGDRFSFDTKSSLTFVFERFVVWSLPSYRICMSKNVRFLVRNSANWYVSERVLGWQGEGPSQWGYHTLSFLSSSDDGRWAEWNPASADGLKFDPTTASFFSIDFQDVQAVGFVVTDDDWYEAPWTKPVPGSDPPYYLTPAEQFTSVGNSIRLVRFEAKMMKNVATNRLPVAQFTMNATTVRVGDTVLVDARSSYDPDDFISFTTWNFGDGRRSSGPLETNVYTVAGIYTITVTVSDGTREQSTQAQRIFVLPPNTPPSAVSTTVAGWWGAYETGLIDCINVGSCSARDPFRGSADLDNDGSVDDFYLHFPFAGAERPLFPTLGTKLIGGFRFESANSNTSFINSWIRLVQAGHNNPARAGMWDSNGVRAAAIGWDPVATTTNFTRFAVLFAIDKSQFLNGADQSVVSFDSDSVLYAGPWMALGRLSQWLRFAVRDGNEWFVSEFFYRPNVTIDINLDINTGYGNASAEPPIPPSPIMTLANPNAATRWVSWNPSTSMFAPTSGYVNRVFTNVTAMGVTAQLPDWTFTRNSSIAQFSNFRMAAIWMQASYNLASVPLPVARLSATATQAALPAAIQFDASGSTSGAAIRNFRWDFGDGVATTTTDSIASHTYSVSGVFSASVTVRDELDRVSTVSLTITITNPLTGAAGSELNFAGAATVLVREGESRSFLITRTGDNLGTVSVSFRITHISTNDSDIVTDLRRISWGSGDSYPRNLTVSIRDDGFTEQPEQLVLTLSDPYGGAKLGANNAITLQILDSSEPPGATFPAPTGSSSVTEGGANVAGIVVGVIVAVLVVAAAIGVAIWKKDMIRSMLTKKV